VACLGGPKLRASTVRQGDDPGRAAGRSVRRDLAGALPQVHLGVLASGLHALFMGTSPTPTFTSASSSGRSAVRSRRPQPPPSPPGLTVTPTHSSHPPRPARDRRDRRPDRSCGPPTPTRGSAAAGDPTRRRARAGPPHAPPCRARRFSPRVPLLPCLAAHPVLRKCRSLAHHHRCFLYPCLSPLPPRRRHAVARRAPASSGREVDALELALPGERLLMRPEFGDRGCSSVLMMVHQTIPRPLSRSARVSSVSRYVW